MTASIQFVSEEHICPTCGGKRTLRYVLYTDGSINIYPEHSYQNSNQCYVQLSLRPEDVSLLSKCLSLISDMIKYNNETH